MSRKSKILIVGCSLVGVLLAIAIPNFIRARSTSAAQACINNLRQIDAAKSLFDLERDRLGSATEAFIRDQKARGTVPVTVTFSELVSGRYLSNSEVAIFSNAEVTVSLRATKDSPKAVWIRVHFADGLEMVQSADGNFVPP